MNVFENTWELQSSAYRGEYAYMFPLAFQLLGSDPPAIKERLTGEKQTGIKQTRIPPVDKGHAQENRITLQNGPSRQLTHHLQLMTKERSGEAGVRRLWWEDVPTSPIGKAEAVTQI